MTKPKQVLVTLQAVVSTIKPSVEDFNTLEYIGDLVNEGLKKAYLEPDYKLTDLWRWLEEWE